APPPRLRIQPPRRAGQRPPLRARPHALTMTRLACLVLCALLLAGCDVFGSKDDPITDEIFDEGQTDPTLVEDVGYVALTPFFTQGAFGAFERPTDVFVGYDRFIYVGDRQGLHVLDLAGRPQNHLGQIGDQPLRDIEAIVQDRRLDVYIAARRDTTIDGRTWNLPVVYRV